MNKQLNTILDVHLRHKRYSGQSANRVERALRHMLVDMDAAGEKYISYKHTMSWLQSAFPNHNHNNKMARYSYVQMLSVWANAIDSRHQVLPKKSIQRNKRIPNILTRFEVIRLMDALAKYPTRGGFNGYTSSVITGLMFVTGMRIGEALELKRENFDRENATIYIPTSKTGDDRYIPLHRTTTRTLLEYLKMRDARFPDIHDPFFLFDRGIAKTRKPFADLFRAVSTREDIKNYLDSDIRENPLRPHDLRHSFAVNSLIKCYEDGRNIDEEVAKLSIILGHKSGKDTYWYITAVPQLLEIAMKLGAKL